MYKAICQVDNSICHDDIITVKMRLLPVSFVPRPCFLRLVSYCDPRHSSYSHFINSIPDLINDLEEYFIMNCSLIQKMNLTVRMKMGERGGDSILNT